MAVSPDCRSRWRCFDPFSAAIVVALSASCAMDEQVAGEATAHLLAASFTEEFHIGDQPSERLFVDITSMAFDPDGRLVVLDRDEFAVTMFDVDGTEVARWGNKGEGPGEFENPPSALAVSDDARIVFPLLASRPLV